MDEGILRATRFAEAGADVTLVDGLPSREALARVGREVPGHKVINLIHGGKTPLLPSDDLHSLGFKIVLYSTPALYTATRTMLRAMTLLAQSRDLNSISPESLNFQEFQGMMESTYFRRRGSEGLARIAAPVAPVSQMRLHAARFDAEEPRTGSHG
jgi:2-methylisocitrate lyase-like PEP mutase family enzyme